MKRILILMLLALLYTACTQSAKKEEAVKNPVVGAAIKTVVMKVEGMTCTGCETTIQTAVGDVPGVSSVKADYVAGKATVAYDTTKTNLQTIAEAIKNSGYQVTQ